MNLVLLAMTNAGPAAASPSAQTPPSARTTGPQQSPAGPAKANSQDSAPAAHYRLVSVREGRHIVSTAWAFGSNGRNVASEPNADDEGDDDAPPSTGRDIHDCSHVVHDIYRAAGYDYLYASSFDLYRGTPNFVRVKNPQPGDVIVWPGHAGIVLNARQHSFYSLVSTGLQSQKYTGAYWRGRGHPHFFRFLVQRGSPQEARIQAASERTAAGSARPYRSSLDPPAETSSASAAAKARPVGPVQDPAEQMRLRTDSRGNGVNQESAEPTGDLGPARETPTVPVNKGTATTEADALDASAQPARIAIATANARPTRDEVTQSLVAATKSGAEALIATDPLQPATPIVIFEQLAVERVDTKNDRGWVQLKIDSRVSITRDGVDFKRRHEKVRWELRRGASGWEAFVPSDRVLIPRDPAAHALAARLAELTQREGSHQPDDNLAGQEARIANLLSALLDPR